MSAGLLILRVIVGALFIGHGTQKLFGWFGGHGLQGTGGFVASLGFRPGRFWAFTAGFSEAMGGLMFAVGLITPLAAAMIIGMMVSATVVVHWKKGLWNTNGGYELPLVYATIALAVAWIGPGAYSIDRLIPLRLHGPASALGAATLAYATAFGAEMLRRRPAREQVSEREREAA